MYVKIMATCKQDLEAVQTESASLCIVLFARGIYVLSVVKLYFAVLPWVFHVLAKSIVTILFDNFILIL